MTSSGVANIRINEGYTLLPGQLQALMANTYITGIFGGWGSGKTFGAALAFVANCLANPWRPEYGEDNPMSVAIGITFPVLKDSGYKAIRKILPRDAILREWKSPEWRMRLVNGHDIIFRTAAGSVEGINACGLWLDEAHLLPSKDDYMNYQMRVRDILSCRKRVLVSGLPEFGWLQDTFADDTDHDRRTIMLSSYDNKYLDPMVLKQYRASCADGEEIRFLEGKWARPKQAIYHAFGEHNYAHEAPDATQPIRAISIDVGETGAVLWFQERRDGLLVVDEYLPTRKSMTEIAREVLSRHWKLKKGYTKFYVDPATDRDEMAALKNECLDRGLGTFDIIRKKRGDSAYSVEYGIRCVNTAFRNADGNTRLWFYSGLPSGPRSLLRAIRKYRRHEKTGEPVKDNITDHVLDVLRYPVADLLPLHKNVFQLRKAR